jgi:hypothetical protein
MILEEYKFINYVYIYIMHDLPKRFNYKFYILLNPDLEHFNEEEAISHYQNYGYYENRKYSLIPKDFNYKDYLLLNPDLDNTSEEIAILHYENYGYYENRKYKKNNNNIDILLEIFLEIHNLSLDEYKKDTKIQFRFICYKNINYIKKQKQKNGKNKEKHVLIGIEMISMTLNGYDDVAGYYLYYVIINI